MADNPPATIDTLASKHRAGCMRLKECLLHWQRQGTDILVGCHVDFRGFPSLVNRPSFVRILPGVARQARLPAAQQKACTVATLADFVIDRVTSADRLAAGVAQLLDCVASVYVALPGNH